MKPRKINVTTMLDPSHFNRLTEISRETGKSVSSLIREAVSEYLSQHQKRPNLKRTPKLKYTGDD